MNFHEKLPHNVREIENLWIPMADGCRLAARVWLPEGAEGAPVPAILEYLPYRKRDFTRRRDEGMHRWFAGHGYVAVRVDMRGSGESDGLLHDEYLRREQDDALEVIDWIARQPWCSGRVGMMGKSWGAFNALQVAARRPEALKAIIAVMGTDDRFAEDVHYSGGCLLNDNFWWGCIMQVFNARPPDPEIVGDRWREMWLERLEAERFWPDIWLAHQAFDEYWKHGSVCVDYPAVSCPAWIWGGWADLYRDSPFRLAEHLTAPHRVTVGPWAHLYPHEGIPGPAVGFLQETLRWWDHWLKGEDRGVLAEPPYQFFMMNGVRPAPLHQRRAGRWIAERQWPSPHVAIQEFAINEGGLDLSPAAEQTVSIASPQSTGLAAGDWGSFAIPGDLPADQSLDSFGSLEFDSAVLTDDLEILGNTLVLLDVAADRSDAAVAVRLIDVAPDRSAALVARGVLNLAFRDNREAPAPLTPGTRYRVQVQLTGTAYAFAKGHRIRLAISTAYWPIIWPSPAPVTLTIFTGASALRLPVRARQSSDQELRALPAPVAAPVTAITSVRAGRLERSVVIDQLTGAVSHRLFIDGGVFGPSGKVRLDSVDMEMGHLFERIYSVRPDDPNSAKASMTQTYEMGRAGWRIRIEAGAEMTSTVRTFEVTSWIEAYENDHSVFRKECNASVERRRV
jgi:uncharacterized protein